MAAALAAVAGLAAGLYGLAYGLCFAAISGTLAGVLTCGLFFALAGAAAGAIVGAFGTLIGGDPIEPGERAPSGRGRPAAGVAVAPPRHGTVRVWTEIEEQDEVFSTSPPDDSGEPTNHRKERPWT